ncbi:MAG: TetR/AcrR family transcriptional regulator [Myxococcales bacterium FL481]|nr:MAG: TetR/AcrR family transcriptional regulator [Myxococcales bacterium FL481]
MVTFVSFFLAIVIIAIYAEIVNETAKLIRKAATQLFAERGYAGTSVRAICQAAGTNVNGVSYHFGGKQALYEDIISRSGDDRLASAQRLLGLPPGDAADLESRLLLFAEETLAAHLRDPEPLIILYAETQQRFRNCDPKVLKNLSKHNEVLLAFLASARRRSLLRKGVDIDIVAGTLLERLNNQVHHADFIESVYGTSIKEPKYRRHWSRQTIDLLLHGAVRVPSEEP